MKYIKVIHSGRGHRYSIWACKDFRHGVKCVASTDPFYVVGLTESRPYRVWKGANRLREEYEITEEEAFLELV